MLGVLCRQDPSFLYRTLSCLKALQARLCGDPACARALLPLAQFFLSHGELRVPRAQAARPREGGQVRPWPVRPSGQSVGLGAEGSWA